MTEEQLGKIYHTARNAATFRDFKSVALDILSASIADTAGAIECPDEGCPHFGTPHSHPEDHHWTCLKSTKPNAACSCSDTAGAIYQIENGEGGWIDVGPQTYKSAAGDVRRVVYAAPPTPSVADAAESGK